MAYDQKKILKWIFIGTHDLGRLGTLLDVWKYHLQTTLSLVWLGASEAPAPLWTMQRCRQHLYWSLSCKVLQMIHILYNQFLGFLQRFLLFFPSDIMTLFLLWNRHCSVGAWCSTDHAARTVRPDKGDILTWSISFMLFISLLPDKGDILDLIDIIYAFYFIVTG